MKIQILSDLHTEFHRDRGQGFVDSLDPIGVNVLIVAGDVSTDGGIGETLGLLCAKYPHVVYTPGNHEYYFSSFKDTDKELKRISRLHSNLHVLMDSTVTLYGQRFIGCTLWFKEAPMAPLELMSDPHEIKDFTPEVYRRNEKSIKYLWDNVRTGDVVVTHHMPTPQAIDPEYRNSTLNAFFVCDMERLIEEKKPAVWAFGHTHTPFDEVIEDTRLVCNPLGYIRSNGIENPDFDNKKIIEIIS